MGQDDLFDAAIRLEKKCAAVYRALNAMFAEKQDLCTPTISRRHEEQGMIITIPRPREGERMKVRGA